MVDMHMGHHQRPHRTDIELDLQTVVATTSRRRLRTLKQAAVKQDGIVCIRKQLVAGAGNAVDRAVMGDMSGRNYLEPADWTRWAAGVREGVSVSVMIKSF